MHVNPGLRGMCVRVEDHRGGGGGGVDGGRRARFARLCFFAASFLTPMPRIKSFLFLSSSHQSNNDLSFLMCALSVGDYLWMGTTGWTYGSLITQLEWNEDEKSYLTGTLGMRRAAPLSDYWDAFQKKLKAFSPQYYAPIHKEPLALEVAHAYNALVGMWACDWRPHLRGGGGAGRERRGEDEV